MKRFSFFLLLFVVVASAVWADNITVDGINRSYNIIVPNNLGEGRPLLIFCHGYSQDAGWMQNNEFKNDNVSMEAVCDTAKFVCVFPNGINNAWELSGNRDVNFIKAIIEKMAAQHKIDRNRIYLGGFSMGGMLTYNAINKLADIVAAFVSCSGPSVVTPSASTRPVPILHIQGTADNWGGVQPVLNPWIQHNGCGAETVVSNYNGFSGAKMHTWGGGKDGVEVKLLELKDKGHWICKEPQVYTGKEIWNFCRRYSLKKTSPNVRITSPTTGKKYISFAPRGEAVFPDITLTATANDPNGTIEKVEFYDGVKKIATCTEKPYTVTLSGISAAKHTLKAVATDNDGETGSASIEVTLQAPIGSLTLSTDFKEGNALPAGWTTYDSSERRTGYSSGYTSGCRVLQFTGSQRGFNYGLYIRNINGNAKQGWAKYGLSDGGTTISLATGHYTLKYKICTWNMSNFGEVELDIEKRTGSKSVAKQTYTPDINIGNVASNNFNSPTQQVFEFDIEEQGYYVIAAYSANSGWSDCIIGQLLLTNDSYVSTGIEVPTVHETLSDGRWRDLAGRQVDCPTQPGVYIKDGKKVLLK